MPFFLKNLWLKITSRIKVNTTYGFELFNPCCILALTLIGIFFIHWAQSYTDGKLWETQIKWMIIGFIAYLLVSLTHYKFWLENATLVYAVGILLLLPLALQSLIEVYLPHFQLPFALTRWGSTRWLDFKFFTLQPSEIAKVGVLLFTSSTLARARFKTIAEQTRVLVKISLALFLPLLLIFSQPDLGSCLVFLPLVLCLLYVAKLSRKILGVFGLLVALGISILAWDIHHYQNFMEANNLSLLKDRGAWESRSILPLRDYQRNRILTFLDPASIDPRGTGVAWNLNQSLYAIAGGGLTGKGLGQGTQAKLGYLPPAVAANDFIFCVVAEESGFLGGLTVIVLFTLLIINNIYIASLAKDRFGMLLACGVATLSATHVFINIGMTLGLMPITGLPLPFVSYGGSFLIICFVSQGFVQSVYRFRRDFS